ncbi:Fic family protein [Paludibaculum fermentans]|uniref:Fic family protein n=1 Tax=Paludibaculum fermentans TaxID=1473598 RepID=UPI003EB8CF03
MSRFDVAAPVRRGSCVSDRHISGSSREENGWAVFDRRYWPGDAFGDQLTFALKHEEMDLLVLKRIFEAVPRPEMEAFVRSAPTGGTARRGWFLYETLLGRTLDVDDAARTVAVDALDPELYFTGKVRVSKRHRVRDNLLGTGRFSPVIRRTKALTEYLELDLPGKARETIGRTGAHLIARAASFLLLADSRASFEIEGERPPRNRLERWGRAIQQAGKNRLTLEEILRLQRVLIEDTRFVRAGLRAEGVFVGDCDLDGGPSLEFIGARAGDLGELMTGLLAANDRMREDGLDAVLMAAATAFAFVYIHPFQDGNGRMHRCLIHHVLTERQFTPPGLVFPVSSVMLDRVEIYRSTLQAHSAPLMPFIEWRPTPQRNVEVLNETADLYRYFDCTEEAEFLYSCVRRTVEEDLPREIDYLGRHDEATRLIMEAVEMPDRMAADLVAFVRQNRGSLSSWRRNGEFSQLRDEEVSGIEEIVQAVFEGLAG